MPNSQHVPCCLIANPHPHLIYACSTSEKSTSPLNLHPLGGKLKKDNDLVTRGVEWVVCKIKFMNLHPWSIWMDMAMEINKLDGWWVLSYFVTLVFLHFLMDEKSVMIMHRPFSLEANMVYVLIIIRLRKFTHLGLILKHNHKNMGP
jgi:hypothetical protein